MSSNASHATLLNKVYYDPAGYGSTISTYDEAGKQDKTITSNTIKQWFNSNLEATIQVKGSNTFVVPYPFYAYQVYLMFFSGFKNQKLEQGMLCVDIFTNYDVVVPIKSKTKEMTLRRAFLNVCIRWVRSPKLYIQMTRVLYINHQYKHN